MRNCNKQKRFFPIKIKCHYIESSKSKILENCQVEFFPVSLPEHFNIVPDRFLLVETRNRGITHERKEVILFCYPVRYRIIPCLIIEKVMILIMSRYPTKCRKAVKQG